MSAGIIPDAETQRASLDELSDLYRAAAPIDSRPENVGIPDLSDYGLDVVELLGKGGMGAVYRARQRHPAREVAVKILSCTGPYDGEHRERFEREIHALSCLDSPYVVPIYGTGTTSEGLPFYVMELIQGVPLEDYAEHCQMTVRERLVPFVKICEGVQAAHRLAIIHRDLKPANVLVDNHGRPRILDLGLAKFIHGSPQNWATISQISQLMGTPAFMAPEQFHTDADVVDTRVDCYSLGVMLYRLVLGVHPFIMPDGILATMRVVGTTEPTRPRQLCPSVPRDLEAILLKALEKEPDRRYQSAAALGDDIERFLGGLPVQAQLPTLSYRTRKFISRNVLPVTIASVAALLLLLLGGTSLVEIIKARSTAETALGAERGVRRELARESYLNSLPAIDQRLRDNDFVRAARMLEQSPPEERSWEWQRMVCRAIPWLVTLSGDQPQTCLSEISDTRCVSGDATGQLTLWDLTTGAPARVWRGHDGSVEHIRVSPQGDMLLSTGLQEARLWDVGTGRLIQSFPLAPDASAGKNCHPAFGPHGLIMIPQRDGIRFVERSGEVKTIIPVCGQLTFCSAFPRHNLVAWSGTLGEGTPGGYLEVHRLQPDGTYQSVFVPSYEAQGVAISDDGMEIAVAGNSETRVKDLDTGNFHVISRGRVDGGLTFMPGSSDLLVSSARGLEILRRRSDTDVLRLTLTQTSPQAALPLGRRDELLVLDQGNLHILSTRTNVSPYLRGPAAGTAWELSPDGTRLAVVDETLAVYDTSSGRCVRDLGRRADVPTDLSFSPDGRRLAAARTGQRSIVIYELPTGTPRVLPPCPGPVLTMALGAGGAVAVVTTDDTLLLGAGDPVQWSPGAAGVRPRNASPLLRFDASTSRLLVGTQGGGITLIDGRVGKVITEFPSFDCLDATFDPNGRWLLMTGIDTAVIWDLAARRKRGELRPFTSVDTRRAARFTPDGRRVIIGEKEGISIWDVDSSRKLSEETVHLPSVADCRFDAHGGLVALGPDGAMVSLAGAPSTDTLPAELHHERLVAWQRRESARVVPSPAQSDLVVCLVGVNVDHVPGTPGGAAEELGLWNALGAETIRIPAAEALESISQRNVRILHLRGFSGTPFADEVVENLVQWVAAGGRLFLTGTDPEIAALLPRFGLPTPGPRLTTRIPASLPGTLPVNTPVGAYRLLHAASFRSIPNTSGPASPCIARTVGRGTIVAVLADRWCDDAPDPTDKSRCYLGRADNRRILKDCISTLAADPATSTNATAEVSR